MSAQQCPIAESTVRRYLITGGSHGVDIDSEGQGVVTAQPLYRLVRDPGMVADHTFEIRFLDPGVQAHAFMFG